nr:thiamine phosphate synthase [Polycladospora coralii]
MGFSSERGDKVIPLSLYLILGSQNCKYAPEFVLQEAIRGGVTMFQFREKGESALPYREKRDLAKRLQQICQNNDIPFIVNDDIELTRELNADGIHIGQDDRPLKDVRAWFPDKIVGVSAHDVGEASKAMREGADYLGVGPMYHTDTKPDIELVKGPAVIQAMRKSGIQIPIVGIGGITHANAEAVLRAGADGIAVISAITKDQDPYQAAQMFCTDKTKRLDNKQLLR